MNDPGRAASGSLEELAHALANKVRRSVGGGRTGLMHSLTFSDRACVLEIVDGLEPETLNAHSGTVLAAVRAVNRSAARLASSADPELSGILVDLMTGAELLSGFAVMLQEEIEHQTGHRQ